MNTELRTTDSRLVREPRPPRFAGKVALITGASDKGIGGALARRMAEEGAAVSLMSRGEPTHLLKRLRKSGGHGCVFTLSDICNQRDVDRAIDFDRLARSFSDIQSRYIRFLLEEGAVDDASAARHLGISEDAVMERLRAGAPPRVGAAPPRPR